MQTTITDKMPGYLKAAGIGAIAGMRSMTALALASDRLKASQAVRPPFTLLASAPVAMGLKALAAGEMAADKHPKMPNRTAPVALAGRAVAGAIAGGAVSSVSRQSPLVGALIGGLAAVAATYASFHLRKAMGTRFNIPDKVVGALEDALATGGGLSLGKLVKSSPLAAILPGKIHQDNGGGL